MTKRSHSPQWLRLAKQVINSDRYPDKAEITFNLICDCVAVLMDGRALSPGPKGQAMAFIRNINMHIPHMVDFDWSGSIMLTRKQQIDGRKKEWVRHILEERKPATGLMAIVREDFSKKIAELKGDEAALERLWHAIQGVNKSVDECTDLGTDLGNEPNQYTIST